MKKEILYDVEKINRIKEIDDIGFNKQIPFKSLEEMKHFHIGSTGETKEGFFERVKDNAGAYLFLFAWFFLSGLLLLLLFFITKP